MSECYDAESGMIEDGELGKYDKDDREEIQEIADELGVDEDEAIELFEDGLEV